MTTKNLPARLLAIIAIIGAIGACAVGIAIPAANAPGLDPVRYAEADATRTAQAPEIYATETFNRDVLPTQQAVEASEIAETTQNKYHWQRNVDQASAVARITIMSAATVGAVLASAGAGIWGLGSWGARGIRAMRKATLPMTYQLTEGPHVTECGTMIHTVTGTVVALDAPQDAQTEHGRLIAEAYATTPAGMLGQILQIQREMQRDERRLLT